MTDNTTDLPPREPESGVPPWTVGLLRGVLEAAVLALLGALIVALSDITTGEIAPFAPIGVLLLRQIEALADQRIDPTKQRIIGGAPAVSTYR